MTWKKATKILKWTIIGLVSIVFMIALLIFIFKDDIKRYAIEEANKYLNKKVLVEQIDINFLKTFPNVSLSFENVLIYDRFDTIQTLDTTLFAQTLQLRFNVLDFFKSNYAIHRIDLNNGLFRPVVLEDGQINYDLLKESEDTVSTPFDFNLNEINIKNLDFQYDNRSTLQFYKANFKEAQLNGFFSEKQFLLNAQTDFDINAIRSQAITLIENKSAQVEITIEMDKLNQIFSIKDTDLSINQLPFQLGGKVGNDSLDFYLRAVDLNLEEVANNFAFKELGVVHEINGKGKVNFDLTVQGKLDRMVSPAIDASFKVEEGSLSENGFDLTQINLNGYYSNGIKSGEERIELSSVKLFTLNEYFQGKVLITEFEHPKIKGNAKGMVDLKTLHRIFGPFDLKQLSGNVFVDGDFDFRLNPALKLKENIQVQNFKGTMELKNVFAEFQNQRKIGLNSGKLTWNNQHLKIKNLELESHRSAIQLSGNIHHILDYFAQKKNLKFDLSLSGKAVYWEDLFENNKENETQERGNFFPDNIEGKLQVDVPFFRLGKHIYKEIKGIIDLKPNALTVSNLRVENAGAKISGNLKVEEKSPMLLQVSAALKSNKIDMQALFKEWNNFDQQVITHRNIRGNADVSLDFYFSYDLYTDLLHKEDLRAKAKIKIKNGELNRVQTFREVTNSLRNSAAKLLLSKKAINSFENRLMQLKFEELENEIKIENETIFIPKMVIKSNALNVNFEGSHTFDNQIDYTYDFRFRDLKADKDSQFGEVIDDQTGFRVFLKMTGDTENTNFSWDKETRKEVEKEKKKSAKEDFKSAVKTGFGIQIGDSAVSPLEKEKKREEKVIMEFENDKKETDEPKKEKGFLQRQIDKWKKEKKEDDKKQEPLFDLE